MKIINLKMNFNLNNRAFKSKETTNNGEVSKDTIFHYKQFGGNGLGGVRGRRN